MSNGVDFNNQFDFRNTHAPYLLDQRHRLTVAWVYQPFAVSHFESKFWTGLTSNWTLSSVMLFSSGRPFAPLLDSSPAGSTLNDSAANQSTANSALGINGAGPSPAVGLNSFYGPWTQQVDLSLGRRFAITERQALTLQLQAFNVLNHANYYVQNGNGVDPIQYAPTNVTANGAQPNCGDGISPVQSCLLIPSTTFKTLQVINAQNGPRVLQFALKYTF